MTETTNAPATSDGAERAAVPWRPLSLAAAVVVAFTLGLVFKTELQSGLAALEELVKSAGWAAPLVYIAIYVIWTVACLPGVVITLLGGSIFAHDPVIAIASVSVGSTLGAALCFLISRHLARDQVRRWVGGRGLLGRVDAATERYGAAFVAVSRIVPFPFNLLNYAFGLTGVGFWTYVVVSWVCMLPATAAYVLSASAVTRGVQEGQVPWGILTGLGIAVAIMISVGVVARRKWSAMATASEEGDPETLSTGRAG